MWSDKETTADCLGFRSYVESLATICIEPDLAPLALGVFGSWGSGKSSLMRMLEQRIKEEENIVTVWANAWRYEGKDEMQSALIHAILAVLSAEKTLGVEAYELLNRLKNGASVLKLGKFISNTVMTMTPDIPGLIDCFSLESEKIAKTMAQFETNFTELLEKVNVDRVVVFIDDLDRCQAEKVIETFETIKLFLNIPDCTFVIGAAAQKIEEAIKFHYPQALKHEEGAVRSFSEDYLEKIIQIPFRIPEQTVTDIGYYVGMLTLQRFLKKESWGDLTESRADLVGSGKDPVTSLEEWCKAQEEGSFLSGKGRATEELRQNLRYIRILARGLRGNPRQIKRFLNILGLRRHLARNNSLEVKEDLLIKILVLEYTWKWLFLEVATNYDYDAGKSELLDKIATKPAGSWDEDSELVSKALNIPGLPEFLSEAPHLHGKDVDLRPYLFLAQTAQSALSDGVLTLEEEVDRLVERIKLTDSIKSKSATRDAIKADTSVAVQVVKRLATDLESERANVQVQIVNAFKDICAEHKDATEYAIAALKTFEFSKNQAVGLITEPVLRVAEKQGITVTDIRTRVQGSSRLNKAMATSK